MAVKVGNNGFGRIGRLVFRAACSRPEVDIVGINDLIDVEYMAYMLKYDSTHGRFNGTVEVKDGKLVVNGKAIRITAEKDPANLKWNEVGAEYVVESTGLFLDKPKAEAHIRAGAQVGTGNDNSPNQLEAANLNTGLTLVGKRARIPERMIIGRNCRIDPGVTPGDFGGPVPSGGAVIKHG